MVNLFSAVSQVTDYEIEGPLEVREKGTMIKDQETGEWHLIHEGTESKWTGIQDHQGNYIFENTLLQHIENCDRTGLIRIHASNKQMVELVETGQVYGLAFRDGEFLYEKRDPIKNPLNPFKGHLFDIPDNQRPFLEHAITESLKIGLTYALIDQVLDIASELDKRWPGSYTDRAIGLLSSREMTQQ